MDGSVGSASSLRLSCAISESAAATLGNSGASPSVPSAVTIIECGKPFQYTAIMAEIVGFLAASAFAGYLLQLFFEFFLGELAAFQARAGIDDFLDVKGEDIAPAKFPLGALAPPHIRRQPPPALLERQAISLAISS